MQTEAELTKAIDCLERAVAECLAAGAPAPILTMLSGSEDALRWARGDAGTLFGLRYPQLARGLAAKKEKDARHADS